MDKYEEGLEFLFEAIDNLAGIYKGMGDYHRALSLLNYSYQQKLKKLPENSDALYKSEILLGQAYLSVQDMGQAKKSLQKSFDRLHSLKVQDDFWLGDAHYALARVYESCNEKIDAQIHYEKAREIYSNALGENYDHIYLDFLHHLSLFYAENGQLDKALQTAHFSHQYTSKNEGLLTVQSYWNLLGLSKIFLLNGQVAPAEKYVNEALQVVHQLQQQPNQTLLDKVRLEQLIPAAELLKAKIQHKNILKRDVHSVTTILQQLLPLETYFQSKKMFLLDEDDISQVNKDYQEVLDFIHQLHIELYAITQDTTYLHEIVQRHESNVYARIRNHLYRQSDLRFSTIPDKIEEQEKILRQNLLNTLQSDKDESETLKNYDEAEKKWVSFESMLQQKYPEYYQVRFQNPSLPDLKSLQQLITADQTLIRYFFIDQELYALVIDQKEAHWEHLKTSELAPKILQLLQMEATESQICQWSFDLYQQLWQPLEKNIQHSRVMIIPEGILYYLSFDMLSQKKSKSYFALKHSALVQKYAISYHYSLFALSPLKRNTSYKRNFIAFVPEFSDENKHRYRQSSKGQIEQDEEYFSLLPLPFSVQLAKKAQKLFGGNVYAGDMSHIQNFKKFGNNSAIVHIGTHASANDEYPEYSKLIFSKNIKDLDEENVLFLYDIYQHQIQSDITVLTACESGKTGLFPGEGMISMAHAFNYAGSKSILTGLWNIDEQSTTMIVEAFYKHLKDGDTKDIALQKAKVHFLQSQNGRRLHPQYWAGLVLLGDIAPIEIQHHFSPWILLLIGGILGGVLLYFGKRKF